MTLVLPPILAMCGVAFIACACGVIAYFVLTTGVMLGMDTWLGEFLLYVRWPLIIAAVAVGGWMATWLL